ATAPPRGATGSAGAGRTAAGRGWSAGGEPNPAGRAVWKGTKSPPPPPAPPATRPAFPGGGAVPGRSRPSGPEIRLRPWCSHRTSLAHARGHAVAGLPTDPTLLSGELRSFDDFVSDHDRQRDRALDDRGYLPRDADGLQRHGRLVEERPQQRTEGHPGRVVAA